MHVSAAEKHKKEREKDKISYVFSIWLGFFCLDFSIRLNSGLTKSLHVNFFMFTFSSFILSVHFANQVSLFHLQLKEKKISIFFDSYVINLFIEVHLWGLWPHPSPTSTSTSLFTIYT